MNRSVKIIGVALSLLLFASIASAGEVVVIVNENGPLVSISDKDIREIFLGEKKIVNDVQIVLLEPKDFEARDLFLSSLIKMNAKEYRIHWIKKVFQEGIQPPLVKESAQEIIDKVKSELGAVAYISREKLKDEKGIMILRTIK